MTVKEATQQLISKHANEPATLKDAYASILSNLGDPGSSRACLEGLVTCAESCLSAHNVVTAQSCLETYFKEVKRYNASALPSAEIRDQFLVRAHYAAGMLVAEQAHHLKGQPLVDGILEAVKHLMTGMEVAAANPRYQFLVYNGSVHFWHAVHPLQCDGLRKHLLPGCERVVLALDKVSGQEEWKVRLLMSLALAQHEAAKADDAAKTLTRAYDMAAAAQLGLLQPEIAQLQHQLSASAGAGKGVKVAAPPAAAAAKKGTPTGAVSAAEAEAALRIIQNVLASKPDAATAEAQLKEAMARVDPVPSGPAKAANLHVVSRCAWAAASMGLTSLAEAWASRAAGAQDLSPRVWVDFTRVLLSLKALGAQDDKVVQPTIQVHVTALEQLDDVVGAFLRMKDVEGVHEASRLIWNTGLLLLQPELHHHVKRSFNSAAKALEVLSSPLGRLRAQLHLEAAKCDMADDALIKAAQEVKKAQSIDYVAPDAERQRFQLQRPLDRYLDPLALSLHLRTSMEEEPQGPEECALLLVERSKESRHPAIKLDLLNKAFDLLASLPVLQPPPVAMAAGPERASRHAACRRRCLLWSDLVRSAWQGSAKVDGMVRQAAPYCLAPAWEAAVDKEMVMLQAEVCYMEAEAALVALRAAKQEIAPPATPAEQSVDEAGVRLPATTNEQLQQLVISSITRGMKGGLAAGEAWLVNNGAILAWNTYLPLLQSHRPAQLTPVLLAVCDMLLQLDPADSDGHLVIALTEALAQATEHSVLLELLRPQPAARKIAEDDDEDAAEEAIPTVAADKTGASVQGGQEAWYQLLPAARVKTAGVDVKSRPTAAALLTTLLPRTEAACERAFARAGNGQPQSLFQAYARLKQLRGAAAALPTGSAAAEQTSKVVTIIESLGRNPSAPSAATDITTAMGLLSALPTVNVELWAKLARVAGNCGVWPAALECAQGAAKVIPPDVDIMSVTRASDLPGLGLAAWFWLGVAQMTCGQAIPIALIRPTGQDMATQLTLRRAALSHLAVAARCAQVTNKADLAETVARAAWAVAAPFMRKALLRCALVEPLTTIVACLNQLGSRDQQVQVYVNCMLVECLCAARMWPEAVAAAEGGCRAIPTRNLHQPLLSWKAAALSQAGGGKVLAEMTRVKEYVTEMQAHTWTALAQHSATRHDQVYGYRRALEAVDRQPWLKSDYLIEYAEWLVSSGTNDGETVEEVLLAAVDALLEYDAGTEEELLVDQDADSGRPMSRLDRQVVIMPMKSKADSNTPPMRLSIPLLESLMRIFVMLSTVVISAYDLVDYLITAHHYAVRMLTGAITSSVSHAKRQAAASGQVASITSIPLPGTLQEWALFEVTPQLLELLAADDTSMALAPGNLPNHEETMAYVDLLIQLLQQRGFDVHCLPLYQLQRCLATLVCKSQGMSCAWTLALVHQMDRLAMSEEASKLEAALGDYTTLSAEDEAELAEQQSLASVVESASSRLFNGRPRSAMAVGRLSFLRKDRASALSDGPRTDVPPPADEVMGGAARPLPSWLEDLARDHGSGDNTSAGAATSLSNVLLLRPLGIHDTLLMKGNFLVSRGHYAAAREMLHRARDHARNCDHREAEARALLLLSRCEALALQTDAACRRVQEAQALGGDTEFWRDSIAQYVAARLNGPHTTTTDAKEALQGGIAMFTTIARDDRAAEKAAMMSGAALKLQLAHLLLRDMANMRSQGVSAWKKWYDQALTLTQQAIASYAAREAGIPHIEALLQQAELMLADPAPQRDSRPRLKKIEKLLAGAENMASKLYTTVRPRDVGSCVLVLPAGRLLSRCRLALAAVQLELAKEQHAHAASDRDKARPQFPKVAGQDPNIIMSFIDDMEAEAVAKGMDPEDSALMNAGSVAQLSAAPADRCQSLLLSGRCLLFKYLSSVAMARHPWRHVEEAASLTVSGSGEGQAEGSSSDTGDDPAAASTTSRVAEEDDDEQSTDKEATAAGDVQSTALCEKAAATLLDAVSVAVVQRCWHTAEVASFELFRLFGHNQPQQAAHHLVAAQAFHSAPHLEELLLAAAPLQLAEALVLTQVRTLCTLLPVAAGNTHYRNMLAALRVAGPAATGRLEVAAQSVPAMLAEVPSAARVVCLQLSPDGHTLYAAALNIPDAAAAAALAAEAVEKKKPPPGKGKGDTAADLVPRMCLVSSVGIDADELASLVADVKAYHASVDKSVRDGLRAFAASGSEYTMLQMPRGKSPNKASPGKHSRKSTPAKGARGDSDAGPPPVPEFDPGLKREWQLLLQRFIALVEPLMPCLRRALPEVEVPEEAAAPVKKTAAGKASTSSPSAPKHAVTLLLDESLALLPWEAMPHLTLHCSTVSRAPSLHMWHACCCGSFQGSPYATEFDLAGMTYLVDPRSECSSPEHSRLASCPSMADAFRNALAGPYGLSHGLIGQPLRVPADGEFQELLATASGILFLGVGRFGAFVPPHVVAGLDLRGCDLALLIDRGSCDTNHEAQLFLDNRKTAVQRKMESAQHTAELLLARGVRAVVVAQAAVTPELNLQLMGAMLEAFTQGLAVGEAAGAANVKIGGPCALAHASSNLMVFGAAHLVASVGRGRKK